jgi:hypothetical protein
MKYESRGTLKKLWDKHYTQGDELNRFFIGCGGFLAIMSILAIIWVALTQGPPDPAWNGVTACQRKYCDRVMRYPYIIDGKPMYANGAGRDGRTVYVSHEEYIQICRNSAMERECKEDR